MPNITGGFGQDGRDVYGSSAPNPGLTWGYWGVFKSSSYGNNVRALYGYIETGICVEDRITFSASASNAIYGNSSTVQPDAINLLPQIKY